MRLGVATAALLLFSGCAIKNHQYGSSLEGVAKDLDGQASVTVYRPGIIGMAVKYPVTVNDQPTPALRANTFVTTEVDAGPVRVQAKGEVVCTITFDAKPDHAYAFRAKNKMGWLYARVQLDAATAAEEREFKAQCIRVPE